MKLCNYVEIEETTHSGKVLFECTTCKHRSPAPTRKRCGKCEACGFPFGTLGHTLNCTELDADEEVVLGELRSLLHRKPDRKKQ